MMLRNEADIISVNIRYHSSMGVTDFFIVDNGSSGLAHAAVGRSRGQW